MATDERKPGRAIDDIFARCADAEAEYNLAMEARSQVDLLRSQARLYDPWAPLRQRLGSAIIGVKQEDGIRAYPSKHNTKRIADDVEEADFQAGVHFMLHGAIKFLNEQDKLS